MAHTPAILACLLSAATLLGAAWATAPSPDAIAPDDEPASPSEGTGDWITYRTTGSYVAAFSLPASPAGDEGMLAAGESSSVGALVPAGATAILVEARWAAAEQPLALHIGDGSDSWTSVPAAAAAAPGYHRLLLAEPVEGEWSAYPFAEPLAAGVSYEVAITVFAGDVPDDFTGLAA